LNKHLQVLSLPDELSKSSNQEILAYLRELKSSPSAEICRMRVMIVGPGDAGKTTLVQRLLTDQFSARQFSMTDGVSMKEWRPTPEMNLSLWDFGGQQVYLNTHAMLFADKTLYVLVWNPRAGTDLRVLEEYVLNVRSRSESGPVMLVTTHGSEVDEKESQRWLPHLAKYDYLSHHNVDSCTGLGIADLKRDIMKFVSEDYAEHSRVLVPGWYPSLESKLKELSRSKFSIERAEFQSLCCPLWRSRREDHAKENEKEGSGGDVDPNLDLEFLQAVKTVLTLFHHWGVIFVLKQSSTVTEPSLRDGVAEFGDIVLNPQSLADVFKCVITCHVNSTSTEAKRELFAKGILHHNQIESIWSGYEPRLCSQFLALLHSSELCYEIFDSNGASTHRSLVPSLLPVTVVANQLDEMVFRAELFSSLPPPAPSNKKQTMVSQGSVRISFDCLLPNFFPKLMVRLRHLSSPLPAHISRHHFVVHLPEWDVEEQVARSSWVCVVEDPESRSLLLYPGCSFGATGICNAVIRELMRESFSGMCVRDLFFTADNFIFSKQNLLPRFDQSNSPPTLTLENGIEILLTFLSPLFSGETLADSTSPFATTAAGASAPVAVAVRAAGSVSVTGGDKNPEDEDSSLYSTLRNDLSQFEKSGDGVHKFALGHSLIGNIPLFRRHGLELPRSPSILWLVGRSECSEYFLYAVSPSVSPSLPWEIVPASEILLTSTHASSHASRLGPGAGALVDSPSRFLMRCLSHLLPRASWPNHIREWSLSFPEGAGVGISRGKEAILREVRQREKSLFVPHLDMFGAEVLYWGLLLEKQRGQSSMEAQLQKMMTMMASNHDELKSNQRTMMTQLDRVEGSLAQLTQQLCGVLVDIREELLLQAKTSCNEEALAELREMWRSGMKNLERAISSSSENVEALIKDEMEDLELKLDAQLTELDSENSERLVTELSKVRNELISANRGRLEGDETSAQKLDQILSEMRSLQSQLDRVEEKMTQFFGNLTKSLSSVQQELQAKGNSEGLQELRELWLGRMGELEDLIDGGSAVVSEAAIEKLVTKIDKRLKERFRHFKITAFSDITPQLTEVKQQLLEVAAAVREGDKKSEQRMESMLVELKGLQTQFVEVILLQTELSENLDEVCVLPPSPHPCPSSLSPLSLSGPLHFEELHRQCEQPHLPHHFRFGSQSASGHGDRTQGNGGPSVRTVQSHPRPAGDCGVAAARQVPHRSRLRGVSLSFRR
jgi:hypothetical protein